MSEDLFLFETDGFSMWPFLKGKEKLIIKRTLPEDLKVGDIILYRNQEQLICHRLVRKIRNKEQILLYARGDNSISLPENITGMLILGRVLSVLKNGRMISLSSQRQQFINRFIVVAAPLISRINRMIKSWIGKNG